MDERGKYHERGKSAGVPLVMAGGRQPAAADKPLAACGPPQRVDDKQLVACE